MVSFFGRNLILILSSFCLLTTGYHLRENIIHYYGFLQILVSIITIGAGLDIAGVDNDGVIDSEFKL